MKERENQPLRKDIFHSYAKIRNLTEGKKGDERDFEKIFKRLADFVGNSGEHGQVQFKIGIGEKHQYWRLELDGKTCKVSTKKHDRPDLEILIRAETALQLAEGSISPIEAFGRGKMRIRGDLELGKRLYKLLAASEGRITPCS